jgi:hypothetical protein
MATLRERMLWGYGLVAMDRAAIRARPMYVVQARHPDGRRWVNLEATRSRALAEDALARLARTTGRTLRIRRARWVAD